MQKNGAIVSEIGIQAHWDLEFLKLEEIEKSILLFAKLGIESSFTELDLTVLPNPKKIDGAHVNLHFKEYEYDKRLDPYRKSLPDSIQVKFAKRYQDIFKLFIKHQDKINRVTFWGVSDNSSWRNNWPIKSRTNYPLLFDRNYQPKKAYYSIMNLE